jgi:hypothetical protein
LKEEVEKAQKNYEKDMEDWRKKYDISEDDDKPKKSKAKNTKKNKDDSDDEH